jgi:DNA polymerase family A
MIVIDRELNRTKENTYSNSLSLEGRGQVLVGELNASLTKLGEGEKSIPNPSPFLPAPSATAIHPLPQGEREKLDSSLRWNDKMGGAKLLLQIHDELIFECDSAVANEVAHNCKKMMENVISLSVPLIASAHIGKSWSEIH